MVFFDYGGIIMSLHIYKRMINKITSSIKIKINVLITTMVLLSLLMTTVIFSNIYAKTVIKQTTQSSIHKLQLIANNIDLLTASIENYARMIITSDQMQHIISDSSANPLEQLNHINTLKGTFSNLIARDDIINSILILNLHNAFIYDIGGNASGIDTSYFNMFHLKDRLLNNKEHYLWSDLYKSPFKVSNSYRDIFTLYESIMDMKTGLINGIITININKSAISSMLAKTYLGKTGEFFMINSEGDIMASSNPSSHYMNITGDALFNWSKGLREGGDIITNEGDKYLVVTYALKNSWRLMGKVPLKEILPPSHQINTSICIVSILIFVMASLISLFFSKRIINPIIHLSNLMRKTKTHGDLTLRADELSYQDEAGLLLSSYNHMMEKISSLIEQVKTEQHLKRQYEVSLINSQVNPHFLYNSLNTICGLICDRDYEKAMGTTQSLGQFYKLALNHGHSLITMEEEIKLIDSYILLQRHAYGEQLTFFSDFDESILSTYIPKFLLQPLVENAFKHGFRGLQHREPVLCLSGKRMEENKLVLCVSDNGNGNDPKYIQQVFDDDLEHFGLHSIKAMLRIHYDNDYVLTWHTEMGKGMRITIQLPIREEYNHDKNLIS